MSKIWDEREKSLENEYFRRKEQELVEKLRAKRDDEEQREKAEASAVHCPKCDGTLKEIPFEGVQMQRRMAGRGRIGTPDRPGQWMAWQLLEKPRRMTTPRNPNL